MQFILPILSLLVFLTVGTGCKKRSSDSAPPDAPVGASNALGDGSGCQANLALLLASALPPVYAPLLKTSAPQLSEVIYGDSYKSLLISFDNQPVVGREEETTADYGKYKVCDPTGACLKTCVKGVCAEEATTATWLEEIPLPDSMVASGNTVFTVYTTSCVQESRRRSSDSPQASIAASNPECGAWSKNIVLHGKNADSKLESLLTDFRNKSLDRQSLAGDVAAAAQQYLASQNTSATGLSLAGTTGAGTTADQLSAIAHNAILKQPQFASLLKVGGLEDVSDTVQTQGKAQGLALAGCATGGASTGGDGTGSGATVTVNNTQTVTNNTTQVVSSVKTVVTTDGNIDIATDAGVSVNAVVRIAYSNDSDCLQRNAGNSSLSGGGCTGNNDKQQWKFVSVPDSVHNNLYQVQSASSDDDKKCWVYTANVGILLGGCTSASAADQDPAQPQLFVAQQQTDGAITLQPAKSTGKCLVMGSTGLTVGTDCSTANSTVFTVLTGGFTDGEVSSASSSASSSGSVSGAKKAGGAFMIVTGLLVGIVGGYYAIKGAHNYINRASAEVKADATKGVEAKAEVKAPGRWAKVGAGAIAGLVLAAAIALIIVGALFDAGTLLASDANSPAAIFQQVIDDAGNSYIASKAQTDGIQTSIDAYLTSKTTGKK